MDKGLIGGSTVLMLLSLLQEKDYYGYEIIKEIEQRSNRIFQFKEGTVYPVLHRMESQGLVKSYKDKAETGKERKYYKITTKGKTQLAKEQKQWNEFTVSVAKVLGGWGMRVPDWEEYLKQVLSHVKFKYDHNSIYFELRDHMEDRYENFLKEGMEAEQAKKAALTCMGDADAIGEELNKAHSPFLGWVWRSIRTVFIILVILNILPFLSLITSGFISIFESYENKTDSSLVYSIDLDYKEKIYDTTLIIDKILYYEDNTLEVRYATWTNPFSNSIKWNSSIWIEAYDEQGEIHRGGGGWKSGSYYGRGQRSLRDIPSDTTKIVVYFGQNGEIPIDLTEGRVMANES